MDNEAGGLRPKSDNADPPGRERPSSRRELNMGEEQLKRWVRVVRLMRRISPAGDCLTFEQALNLSSVYDETYKRFLASRTPIGSLEVRVGAETLLGMIQNHPNGVREIKFKRAFSDGTVLQIWRSADAHFDDVPLLFQELQEVTAEGVSRTQHYPNGQSLTVYVIRESDGEFSIKLSFAAREEADVDRQADTGGPKTAAAGVAGAGAAPKYKARAAGAMLAVLLAVHLFWGSGLLPARRAAGQRGEPYVVGGVSIEEASPAKPSERTAAPLENAADTAPAVETGGGGAAVRQPGRPAVPTIIRRGEMGRVTVVSASEPIAQPDSSPAAAATLGASAGRDESQALAAAAAVVTEWDLHREIKLGGVKRVYVDEVSDARIDANSKSRIRTGVAHMLERQGIEVLKVRADGQPSVNVLTLRFEPDETYSGAIFAELRDGKGQYIWDNKTGCRTGFGGDWGATLDDASQRLGMIMVAAIQRAQSNSDAYQQSLSAQMGGR